MKKCPGCEREVDKYTIACEYCGKLVRDVKINKKESTAGKTNEKQDRCG